MKRQPVAQLLFWCSLVLASWLMLAPLSELPPITLWDKAAHALAFTALMLLGGIAYGRRLPVVRIGILLFGYGMAIEFVQHLLPERQLSLLDMLANGIGVLIAWPLVIVTEKLLGYQTT